MVEAVVKTRLAFDTKNVALLRVEFHAPIVCPHFKLSRSGELPTQKFKSYLMTTQSLKVLPLKIGVDQYIAMHATLTARDFFIANFYLSGQFTCIFSETSPKFVMCWLWLTRGSCVGPQNKIGHPAGGIFPVECPRNMNRLKKLDLWYDDLLTESLGNTVKFVFSPDAIFCG